MSDLSGKKLLILGGIDAMVEVVHRCHELGIIVYVTDYLEDSPAKKVADKSFMISTMDIDAVVDLCQKEHIDGIYTGNIDSMLHVYSKICQKTGLPCYGTEKNFAIMTDKKLFKTCCREYGVPTIEEYSSVEDVKKYPVLVKPIDSSGSRGISVCYTEEELKKGIEKALAASPSKHYLIEKYMTGEEVVLYYYFQDGNPVFAGMCDRYVFKQASGLAQLPTAYIFPSRFTDNHLKQTDEKIKKMFRGIGMTNGPIFLQAFIEDGIPHIYEPGYRTNGAREQYIIGSVCGISSVDMLINFSLTGKMADFDIQTKLDPKLKGKWGCKLSPLIRKGKIKKIVGLDEISELPSVVTTVLNNDVNGEIVEKDIGTLRQIAYRSFIVEDNIEVLKNTIDRIQDSVVYYDDKGESMMLEKFDTEILLRNY